MNNIVIAILFFTIGYFLITIAIRHFYYKKWKKNEEDRYRMLQEEIDKFQKRQENAIGTIANYFKTEQEIKQALDTNDCVEVENE